MERGKVGKEKEKARKAANIGTITGVAAQVAGGTIMNGRLEKKNEKDRARKVQVKEKEKGKGAWGRQDRCQESEPAHEAELEITYEGLLQY